MIKLDTYDLKILDILQRDARSTIKKVARALNLSTTPVFERIKRLEKLLVIDRYVAILNPTLLGKKLTAFIHISIKDHTKASVESFVERVVSFEEVIECHHVSGDSDFLIQVLLEDIEKYNEFVLEKLSVVPNISKLESRFSLSVRKKTHLVYIEN